MSNVSQEVERAILEFVGRHSEAVVALKEKDMGTVVGPWKVSDASLEKLKELIQADPN